MPYIKSYSKKTFASLAIRNFRLYFIGQVVSLCGNWMQVVALGWLAYELSGSGTQLGIVLALQFIPLLLLGMWGGLVADQNNKRRLLYITQTIFGVLSLALSLFLFLDMVTMAMLYVYAFCLGLVRVVDNPTRQTFIMELVGGDNLKNAVSLNATVANLARVVGPALGGVLIATFALWAVFLFNAFSYFFCIYMISRVHGQELHKAEGKTKKKGQIMEGLRYVRSAPVIRNTLLMMAVIGTFAYEFQVSLPIFSDQTFKAEAAGYAALLGAMGLGSVVGGLFAAGKHTITPRQLVIFSGLLGISMMFTAAMPSLNLAIIGMFIVGFFSINVTSLGNTMLQLESEPAMRGRIMALWSMAMIGSTPVGGPIIGFIGEHVGARFAIGVGGFAALATALISALAFINYRRFLTIPSFMRFNTGEDEVEETIEERL